MKFSKKCIVVVLILFVSIVIFFSANYDAEDSMKDYLIDSDEVKITEESEWYFFDGSGDKKTLIFYPGARVEEIAYAKLMYEIAQNGIDCYLVKLPFRLALFNANGADAIISNNNYENIYVGGHSLGGVVAANYAYENMDKVYGLVLLESRASVKLDDNLKALTIYATNDGILNHSAYEKAKSYLPADFEEVIIEGGNHANVANYGNQRGDGIATISKEEQQEKTVKAIVDFIQNH